MLIRSITKMGFSVNEVKDGDVLARLKGNWLGRAGDSIMPITRVFQKYYSELDVKAVFDDEFRVHKPQHVSVHRTADTERWFSATYGITSNEIRQLEEFLYSHLKVTNGCPSFWAHPVFDKLVKQEQLLR